METKEIQFEIKKATTIVFGALGIGLLARRAWDSSHHFFSFAESNVLDLELIAYGFIAISFVLWAEYISNILINKIFIGSLYHQWIATDSNQRNLTKYSKLFFKALIGQLTKLAFGYIILPLLFWYWIFGGISRSSSLLLYGICGLESSIFWGSFLTFYKLLKEKGFRENNDQEFLKSISNMMGLDGDWGLYVSTKLMMAFAVGIAIFPAVPLAFGGGRAENAIVFLKKDARALLPSQKEIHGQRVSIIFKRGTKLGITQENWSNGHVLVIDQDLIERIYTGSKIYELDPIKLK